MWVFILRVGWTMLTEEFGNPLIGCEWSLSNSTLAHQRYRYHRCVDSPWAMLTLRRVRAMLTEEFTNTLIGCECPGFSVKFEERCWSRICRSDDRLWALIVKIGPCWPKNLWICSQSRVSMLFPHRAHVVLTVAIIDSFTACECLDSPCSSTLTETQIYQSLDSPWVMLIFRWGRVMLTKEFI
jgi:hypothetical protein